MSLRGGETNERGGGVLDEVETPRSCKSEKRGRGRKSYILEVIRMGTIRDWASSEEGLHKGERRMLRVGKARG